MAIYHLSVKPISRSAGRSATAAAAYRSGERIDCEREGRTHDYTRKRGVEHCEIFAPDNATWARDRSTLWNAAEAAEKRKNSTVAREYEIALPAELDARAKIELTREFACAISERYGVVADIAIHAPHRDGDARNWHAHVLTTTRRATAEGLAEKTRELDDKKTGPEQVKEIRALWEGMTNRALERSQSDARIDCRSLEAQRTGAEDRAAVHEGRGEIEKAVEAKLEAVTLERPAQEHLGPKVTAMERKAADRAQRAGTEYRPVTDKGHEFVEIRREQVERVQLVARLRGVFSEAREAIRGAGSKIMDFMRGKGLDGRQQSSQPRQDALSQKQWDGGQRENRAPERNRGPEQEKADPREAQRRALEALRARTDAQERQQAERAAMTPEQRREAYEKDVAKAREEREARLIERSRDRTPDRER